MLKKTLLFVGLFSFSFLSAQEVQWASKVLEVSSELTPVQYSAQQALGKPNVFPNPGENPNAWTAANPEKTEFIKVGFDNPEAIQQIMIAESYNPTVISKVYCYDGSGTEYEVANFTPKYIDIPGRALNVFFKMTTYEVHAVKIVLEGKEVPGYHSIDAIGISASNVPIKIEVTVSEDVATGVVTTQLNENVNSEYTEFRPLLSPDGKTLFFSRKNHPDNLGGVSDSEDIWFSEWDETTNDWAKAENIGPVLNNSGPNFISSITPDGNSMILLLGNTYVEKDKMLAGVSMSNKQGDSWSEPEALEIINDYNLSTKANFFMANNRKVLLMSVEREDSRGDRDLYVSFLQEDDKWSEPLNLGDDVNTAGEEIAPFLAADDKTMYFSSRGYSGYGGSDIYVTKRLDDTWTNWSEPANLGADVNSPLDDEFFNIPPTGDKAYYSRGVTEDNLDIFSIDLPTFYKPEPVVLIKGQLVNGKTGEPIETKIIYQRLSDGTVVGETQTDPEGRYEILLPLGENYAYMAEADGFIAISENIDLTNETNYKEVDQNLKLMPIEKDMTITMNNIFFDFDKASLQDASKPELNRILKFMKDNPSVNISLSGYTDSTGPDAYNLDLSQRRADAVLNYFTNNGIAKTRISSKGYGKNDPVADNDTAEGRQKNRRVEFKIVEK